MAKAEQVEMNHKLSRILIRGGTAPDWEVSKDILLPGELCYATNVDSDSNQIVFKIGNGTATWNQLNIDSEGNLDKKTFFSGRGAGITPPTPSESNKTPLGAIRIHSQDARYQKYGLSIDEHGFLSLWKDEKGQIALKLNSLTTDVLRAEKEYIDEVIMGDYITLRQPQNLENPAESLAESDPTIDATTVSGLGDGEYSGLKVLNYDGNEHSILMVTNNQGEWGKSLFGKEQELFRPFAIRNPNLATGPIVWEAVKNEEGKVLEYRIQHWDPAKLEIQINDKVEQTYTPDDTNPDHAIQRINIPTVTAIKVTSKNPEELPPENIYTVENGIISIDLPVITKQELDNWHDKIDVFTINGDNIADKQDKTKAGFMVKPTSLWDTQQRTITFPFNKIFYDNKEVVPKDFQIHVFPMHYEVSASKTATNPISATVVTTVAKDEKETNEKTTFDVQVVHDTVENQIIPSGADKQINSINTAITYYELSFDDYGHRNGTQAVTIRFDDLLTRIEAIEKKLNL